MCKNSFLTVITYSRIAVFPFLYRSAFSRWHWAGYNTILLTIPASSRTGRPFIYFSNFCESWVFVWEINVIYKWISTFNRFMHNDENWPNISKYFWPFFVIVYKINKQVILRVLPLSWLRSISHRYQSIDLLWKW